MFSRSKSEAWDDQLELTDIQHNAPRTDTRYCKDTQHNGQGLCVDIRGDDRLPHLLVRTQLYINSSSLLTFDRLVVCAVVMIRIPKMRILVCELA